MNSRRQEWFRFLEGKTGMLSIEQRVGVFVVRSLRPSWMDSIIEFLAEDVLPNETKEAEKIRRVVARF